MFSYFVFLFFWFFVFNDTATTEIHTLSLHDALPILPAQTELLQALAEQHCGGFAGASCRVRSEEHTSELQSRRELVCRLLLETNNVPDSRRAPRPCPCPRALLRRSRRSSRGRSPPPCRTYHPPARRRRPRWSLRTPRARNRGSRRSR